MPEKHRSMLSTNKKVAYNRDWQRRNPEKYKAQCQRYYRKNKTHHRAVGKLWAQRNRKRLAKYQRQRRKTNQAHRLSLVLRDRIRDSVRRNQKDYSGRVRSLLGCSIESFKFYLKSKFELGMSWDNYGHTGWHIDHIIPCSHFDLSNIEHQKRCFHFSNMQPMWSKKNLSKGAKLTQTHQFQLL